MHGALWQRLKPEDEPYDLPADEPLTLASYTTGPQVDAWLEHVAVGAPWPERADDFSHTKAGRANNTTQTGWIQAAHPVRTRRGSASAFGDRRNMATAILVSPV